MVNANRVNTPTMGEPLRADLEGPAFDEEWELVNCWNAYVFGSEFKT